MGKTDKGDKVPEKVNVPEKKEEQPAVIRPAARCRQTCGATRTREQKNRVFED